MRRHLILLLVPTLLAVLAVSAIWTQLVPKYKAKAEIRVRPITPYLVFRPDDNGMTPFYNSFLNTEVSIVSSLSVLERVLDMPEIQKTKWYKNPEGSFLSKLRRDKIPPIERLKNCLSVQPRRQTEIIDVSFLASDAQDAKLILNAVLDAYMQYTGSKSEVTEEAIYQKLAEKYNSLKNEIQARERVIDAIYNRIGTKTPQELISDKRVRLDQTQADLNSIQQRVAILKWQLRDPNNIANFEPESDKDKLEYQLAQAQFQVQLLGSEIQSQEKGLDTLLQDAQLIESETENIKPKRELFYAVRQRLDQKNMERDVPRPIEVLTRAFVSSKRFQDNRISYTFITLILWLVINSFMVIMSRIYSYKTKKVE